MNNLISSLPAIEAALSSSLLQALWQDTLLGLAAALALRLAARRTAATRHAIGLGFLLAMIAVPAAELVGSIAATGPATAGFIGRMAASAWSMSSATAPSLMNAFMVPAAYASPVWLAWFWVAGVLVMMARLAGGGWVLRSLGRQHYEPLPAAWGTRFEALRGALGIARPVTVKVLGAIEQPFSSRAWRPVVWLPVSMLTQLAPDQIEALLAHELAHIARLDWVWNGLQCLIETLLFFHPMVWWLSRRIRQEREHACDDLAVAVCGDPVVVAEALASVERLRRPLPRLALAANGGALMQRVKRLLGADSPPGIRWSAAAGFAALACASALIATNSSFAAERPAGTASQAGATMPSPTPQTAVAAAATSSPASESSHESWWTYVGDSMRIRVIENNHTRDYHSWVDIKGEPHETYRVDGQSTPIDAGVRQWIAMHHAEPAPPRPPAPPLPPAPPEPPEAPAPPAPPSLAGDPAFKALVQQLQQNTGAVALLGQPILVEEDCHPCRIDDDSSSLHLTVHGPKGSAQLGAEGTSAGGQWRYTVLSLNSAKRIDLSPSSPMEVHSERGIEARW